MFSLINININISSKIKKTKSLKCIYFFEVSGKANQKYLNVASTWTLIEQAKESVVHFLLPISHFTPTFSSNYPTAPKYLLPLPCLCSSSKSSNLCLPQSLPSNQQSNLSSKILPGDPTTSSLVFFFQFFLGKFGAEIGVFEFWR